MSGTRLIGVAVAVPDPWGAELEAWRASFGDPLASAIPAHVTLLPPTAVADPDLPGVEEHLAAAAGSVAPFRVLLRGTGTFRPVSPVVFVAIARGISAFEALERRVRSGPLARDLDFPYHPHVTVAHDLPDATLDTAFDALAGFSAELEVREFVLYVHSEGAWHPRSTFPLGGARRPSGTSTG